MPRKRPSSSFRSPGSVHSYISLHRFTKNTATGPATVLPFGQHASGDLGLRPSPLQADTSEDAAAAKPGGIGDGGCDRAGYVGSHFRVVRVARKHRCHPPAVKIIIAEMRPGSDKSVMLAEAVQTGCHIRIRELSCSTPASFGLAPVVPPQYCMYSAWRIY